VIKHIHRSRMLSHTPFQTSNHPPQPSPWKRIEKKDHGRLVRKTKLSRIRANRLQRKALLPFAFILAKILPGSPMQLRQKFHANDSSKRIIRRHQQSASFSRSKIDEGEVSKVQLTLLAQSLDHFVKENRLRRLIRRVEHSKQPLTPTDNCARRIDAMLPIVVRIAITLAPALWSGIANELPERAQQLPCSREAPLTRSDVLPPPPRGARHTDCGLIGSINAHSPPS